MNVQVHDEHYYDFLTYVNKKRFISCYYQLRYIYDINPKNILEIGVGSDLLKKFVRDTFSYKTLDISKTLKPDIVGDVVKLPLKDNVFDLIVCFQTLEHLPFSEFEPALKEIARVSRKDVLISLPYSSTSLYLEAKLPFLKDKILRCGVRIPHFFRKHSFDGQHYWEVGRKGYSIKTIKKSFEKFFNVKETFNPTDNTYHLFFRLEKKHVYHKQV